MKIAVVIPTHKSKINNIENISFELCIKHLNRYDIIIATGENNNPEFIRNHHGLIVHKFRDSDFMSENSYNRLLLSKRFYESFIEYDYIGILACGY